MFDVLIREAGARFGLGEKALPLVQMLLARMTSQDTGGLPGFLEAFKAAGLGPIIQSWLGGGPGAQPISNSQIETALGASGGLLSQLSARLDANRDNVTSALGYLLPAIVGKLTPGGSMPARLPPEVMSLAAAGQSLLAAPAAAETAAAGGGAMKWLPWVAVALAALIALSYCTRKGGDAPAAGAPEQQAPAPAEPAPAASAAQADAPPPAAAFGGAPPPSASQPAASGQTDEQAGTQPAAQTGGQTDGQTTGTSGAAFGGSPAPADAASSAASAPGAAAAPAAPEGSAVVALQDASQRPALNVYFDSGSAAVHGDFAARAGELLAYLNANATAKAVISGFNDPTGNAAANAELSKNRAQAVQQALLALGVAEERTVLEKPAEATGTAGSNAASRRVEVVLRD